MVLLVHTKYRVNQTITRGRYSQNTIFNMAAVRHFEFNKFLINQHVTVLEPKFESAHQVSSKSDDSRPRYKTIFKMVDVRHIQFSKFDILVT